MNLKECKKIAEINEYINYIIPQIENQIFHCNVHLEFIKASRNVIDAKNPETSWLWHYDDCPSEYLKFVVYLNEVDEQSGCMQFIENPDKNGIFNVGTGEAKTWNQLANALFKALNKEPNINYIDMPENIKNQYQYFTQANMSKLKKLGYTKPFTMLEDAVEDYVENYLNKENKYLR